jgi:hypothetical protein
MQLKQPALLQNSLACVGDQSDEWCRRGNYRARRLTEMTTFTIDNENQIMAYLSAEDANSNPQAQQFTSAKELARLAAKWPATRLVELWNSLPGQKPVKKLDRKAAVARIWAAIQSVAPDGTAQAADTAPHAPAVAPAKPQAGKQATPAAKPAKAPKITKAPKTRKAPEAVEIKTRVGSKTAHVLDLLKRPGGATLTIIMEETGWQAHSVRGFISGTLGTKMGLTVESAKGEAGERTYSLKG